MKEVELLINICLLLKYFFYQIFFFKKNYDCNGRFFIFIYIFLEVGEQYDGNNITKLSHRDGKFTEDQLINLFQCFTNTIMIIKITKNIQV